MLPGPMGLQLHAFPLKHTEIQRQGGDPLQRKGINSPENKCLRFMIFSNPVIQWPTSLPVLITGLLALTQCLSQKAVRYILEQGSVSITPSEHSFQTSLSKSRERSSKDPKETEPVCGCRGWRMA